MQIILLSGGSGQSLWSLSNNVRSKQFLKLFSGGESMLQRVLKLKQIRHTCANTPVTIATAKKQESLFIKYLGEDFDLSTEACRRNTFSVYSVGGGLSSQR